MKDVSSSLDKVLWKSIPITLILLRKNCTGNTSQYIHILRAKLHWKDTYVLRHLLVSQVVFSFLPCHLREGGRKKSIFTLKTTWYRYWFACRARSCRRTRCTPRILTSWRALWSCLAAWSSYWASAHWSTATFLSWRSCSLAARSFMTSSFVAKCSFCRNRKSMLLKNSRKVTSEFRRNEKNSTNCGFQVEDSTPTPASTHLKFEDFVHVLIDLERSLPVFTLNHLGELSPFVP